MAISKQEVEKIAKLARLRLTDQEIEKMQKDLSEILGYFNLLKEAKSRSEAAASTTGMEEKATVSDFDKKEKVLRKDEARPQPDSVVENLVKAAPDKKEKYIRVKAIL